MNTCISVIRIIKLTEEEILFDVYFDVLVWPLCYLLT